MSDARVFLVVEAEGRRHRFPALPGPRRPRLGRPGAWTASFALPSWLEPHLGEEMALWLGNVEILLPTVSFVAELPDVGTAVPPPARANGVAAGPPVPEPPVRAESADGRKATIAALQAELEQRAASEAQLRGALAGANAELEGRAAQHTALEATQSELRRELDELLALVERDSAGLRAQLERAAREAGHLRDELVELRSVTEQEGAERVLLEARTGELSGQLAALRTELAQSDVARVAALSEAAGLRAELERLGAELAHAHGANTVGDGLSEAQSLLVEARAVTARLREANSREQ
jgi:hypothetical protein